jgi:hypothetical protein
VGFALEPSPSLQRSLVELTHRHISHGEPRPFVTTAPDGASQTLWTNVTLTQLSDADRPASARMHIFLSEYAPTYVNVDERRRRLHEALLASSGGPLGVNSVAEVIVGTTEFDASEKLWGALLAPQEASAPGLWQLGGGPAIRLVQAAKDELQGFVIAVASLQRAESLLREKALLGSATTEGLTIDASKIEGLNIRLIEKK